MKTISATSPKPQNPKSILLIGPPGGGKSTLALQFPNVGVVDVDRNLDGPVNRLMKVIPDYTIKWDTAHLAKDGQKVKSLDLVWERAKEITDDMLADEWVKTVVFDGLTMADDVLYEYVLRKQNQSEMRIQDWVMFRAEMIRVIMKCRTANKTFIMICHEEPQLNLKGDTIRLVPSFRSKVSNFFGGFFTDMYRCVCQPCAKDKDHPQGVRFDLYTIPTALSELKNSMMMPDKVEDVTYQKLAKYFV